jgi:hypothetical protein
MLFGGVHKTTSAGMKLRYSNAYSSAPYNLDVFVQRGPECVYRRRSLHSEVTVSQICSWISS